MAENSEALSNLEMDTIGEILNISMGSAATAISTLLDKQVMISTPTVTIKGFSSDDYVELDPAMLIKISYVEGISGSNIMIFKQDDMQIILGLLMGMEDEPSEEFVFDELAISAACEVMNQMMGASATALSDFIGVPINISTPEAMPVNPTESYRNAIGLTDGDTIVSVAFRLTIENVMDSNFASILSVDLAKDIINKVMGEQEKAMETIEPQAHIAPPPPPPAAVAPPPAPPAYTPPAAPAMPPPPAAQPPYAPPAAAATPPPPPYAPPLQDPNAFYGYPPPGAYPPYPAPQYYPQQDVYQQQPAYMRQPQVNVQSPQFPSFQSGTPGSPATGSNMDLLMRVSLDVSVEIGKTKRKIKDILDFGQGTVLELNKQAGAPVDIVVNGCLLARGDVVVIDDNFGVRVTEIVGAKELMESLKEENGL